MDSFGGGATGCGLAPRAVHDTSSRAVVASIATPLYQDAPPHAGRSHVCIHFARDFGPRRVRQFCAMRGAKGNDPVAQAVTHGGR